MPISRFLFAATLATAVLCGPGAWADPKPVELTLSSNTPSPTTTFELRFDRAMAAPAAVGKSDADLAKSPLAIDPPLPGTFTWLDPFRGVFQPAEPMALATDYQLSLRKGLAAADGTPFAAELSQKVTTPPMRAQSGRAIGYIDKQNVPLSPKLVLVFNTEVDPKTSAPFITFVSDAELTIPAQAEHPDKDMWGQNFFRKTDGSSGSDASWREQFREAREPVNPEGAERDGEEGKPRRVRKNQLLISPARPLTPATGWKLVVAPGLPATDDPSKLSEAVEIELGAVRPFEVNTVSNDNLVRTGKHLSVSFSRALAKEVTPETVGKWISIDPAPAQLKAEIQGYQVEYSGEFQVGKNYQVTVAPTIPSQDGLPLVAGFTSGLKFDKIEPRVYSEEFATHQLSSGTRQFHLLAVNVPSVHITAKLIQPSAAPAALDLWRNYERDWDVRSKSDPDEPYQKIDASKLAGKIVFDEVLPIDTAMDQTKEIALDWNKIIGEGRTGVVLITAQTPGKGFEGPRPGVQAIVQVTDLGAVWKTSKHESFLYVFSMATGKPLTGAKLQFFDEKNKPLASSTSGRDGCVRFPADEKAQWLQIRHGSDQHLLQFADRNGIELTRFRSQADGEEIESDDSGGLDSAEQKLMLFTERGVYRPGETIHMKGILRDYSTGSVRPPTGEKLHLAVVDPRERTIFEKDLAVSDSGSFDADVPITGSAVGTYTVTVTPTGIRKADADNEEADPLITQTVQVQEFTPNAFEITLNPPPPVVGPAEVKLPLAAKYYMGKALGTAQVKWTLRAEDDGFSPQGFEQFTFCNGVTDGRLRRDLDQSSDFTQQGDAKIGAGGSVLITASIPINAKAPQPRSAHLLCEVTDVDQQTVSADERFTVDSSDFYLGLRDFPELVHEGDPLPLQVAAVGKDGAPLAQSVEATVRLTRIDWQTNRVEGADDSTQFESTPILHVISEHPITTVPVVKQGHQWAIAERSATGSEKADKPGQYLIDLLAKDSAGREVRTTASFYVYGAGATAWSYRNPFQIDMAPDKESYIVGEKATILVKTPVSGDALVTVERENVRRSWVAQLEGNAPSIEVPLTNADAPNIYVSVMLLRGAADSTHQIKKPEYRVGYARLKVERPASKLTVYVTPDKPVHQPGDPVDLTVEALDYEGKPVSGAELTLFAVDEGVLSLTGYKTPNPLEYFNEERALGVRTGLTLPKLLSEDPEDRDFANKGFLVGDSEKGGDDRIRKNFLACAFWAATLKSGADGKAQAHFMAPDGLTRYRVMAVAQTPRNQFGSADSAFEINKPVMLEPAPPRFANVGDKLLLRAVVHNATNSAGEVEVKLDLDDTVIAEETTRRLSLRAQGSVAVDFPVEFKKMGEANWIWSARFTAADGSATYHDAAQVKLKVDYPTPARHEVTFSRIDGKAADALDKIAPDMLDGYGSVRVNIANSRIAELGGAIHDLLYYPYGCVEQTTSGMLPWIALNSLRGALPEMNKSDEDVRKVVEHGIDRLLTMETESGGLSYWPGGREPMLWASAYGGLGFAMAKRAGFDVPEEDFSKILSYISTQLRGTAEKTTAAELAERCLAVYTLAVAGKAEPAYHEILYKQRNNLSLEDRALLALAIMESKGSPAMIEDLLMSAEPPIEPNAYTWFGSGSRSAAVRLLAWSHFKPNAPAVDKTVTELVSLRRNGSWITTQGNAWSVLALSDYVQRVEHPAPSASGSIAWNGKSQPFQLTGKVHATELTWPLSPDAAGLPFRIANTEKRRLYTEVRVESLPRLIDQPRQESGYGLTRSYYKVMDDGSLAAADHLVVGDRVMVALHLIVRQPAGYIAINDPLPAIFEAINPEFKTQAAVGAERVTSNWLGDYSELREDRALFFRDAIFPGEYTITYLARVRAAGHATAPSARVEEMYNPERFGQTETLRVASVPLN